MAAEHGVERAVAASQSGALADGAFAAAIRDGIANHHKPFVFLNFHEGTSYAQ